jgi:hypothetical protein
VEPRVLAESAKREWALCTGVLNRRVDEQARRSGVRPSRCDGPWHGVLVDIVDACARYVGASVGERTVDVRRCSGVRPSHCDGPWHGVLVDIVDVRSGRPPEQRGPQIVYPHLVLRRIFLVTLLLAPSMASAADECEGKPDAAQCYVTAGRAVLDTNPGEAARLFLASYRLEPKIDPLASLGLALAADHQYAAAAEALEKAVEEYDKLTAAGQPEVDAQTTFAILHRIKAVKEELARITPQIGWVQINTVEKQTLPVGYTIMRKGGTDLRPADVTRLVVKAKGDTLVITYPTGKAHEFPVNVAGGALTSFSIPPEPAEVIEKPPEEPVVVEDPAAKLRKKAYIVGGAGGALFVTGIVYTLAAEDPIYPISIVLIGAGLAGLGIGGYWYYQAENMPKAEPATALVPTFDQHSLGAALVGRF